MPKNEALVVSDELSQAKEEFMPIASRWRSLRQATGEFLVRKIDTMSITSYRLLRKWIAQHHRISVAQQDVCIRVAKGEIEPEIADLISASVARRIPTDRMPRTDEIYEIYSFSEQAPVRKFLKDFSEEDLRHNITKHGVVTLDRAHPIDTKPYKEAIANDFRIDGNQLHIVVSSMRLRVRMKITPDLIKKISQVGG